MCTTTRTASSPVNGATGYPITCVLGTLAATNYDFTFAPGKLTVTKATLTVTADDTSREYGAPNRDADGHHHRLQERREARHQRRDREPGVHDHAHGLEPGQRRTGYPITCVLGTLASGNYDFTFVDRQARPSPRRP